MPPQRLRRAGTGLALSAQCVGATAATTFHSGAGGAPAGSRPAAAGALARLFSVANGVSLSLSPESARVRRRCRDLAAIVWVGGVVDIPRSSWGFAKTPRGHLGRQILVGSILALPQRRWRVSSSLVDGRCLEVHADRQCLTGRRWRMADGSRQGAAASHRVVRGPSISGTRGLAPTAPTMVSQ